MLILTGDWGIKFWCVATAIVAVFLHGDSGGDLGDEDSVADDGCLDDVGDLGGDLSLPPLLS